MVKTIYVVATIFFIIFKTQEAEHKRMLRRAALVIESIELALADHSDDPFPPSDSPNLNDCEFPSCVADPFELIRQVQGDDRARWLEYQDDLECILSELENCLRQQLREQKKTLWDVQGDETGEEPDHSEGVEGPQGGVHPAA
jgi:hypothetical protein